MKLHLLVLALFVGAAIQSSTANESSIEGRVLRAGTGEPIPNTPVTLISSAGLTDSALAALLDQISAFITAGLQGQGGGGNQNATIQAVTNLLEKAGPGVGTQGSVLTDRAGRFAFTNLPRGRYTVWVQRFNYYGPLLNGVPTSTVSATVLADPAKPLPPVDLFLTAGLAITGRVLDSRGQPPPAPAWNVTVFRASYADGRLLWSPVLSRAIDDRGEYRLSPLPPGDYYVGVTPPPTALSPAGQDPPVRTFFPGVIEPAQATKLVLKGNDISNVDFSIRTAPSAFFKISGIAINPSSAATPNAAGFVDRTFNTFGLVPAESHLIDSFTSGQFANVVAAANRAGGEFEIRNVRPGNYELYPLPLYFGFPLGKVYVDVRSADAVGVRLASSSLVGLQGKIVVAGQSPQRPVRFDTVQVILKPWMTPFARAGMPSVPVSPGGDFVVQGPAGARAMLQVTGLPDTAFISDILMGGNSVFSNGFELPAASEQIQVLVDAANGGTVETLVRTVDGRAGSRSNVVLVPDEVRRLNPISYKTGITDNDGRLTLRGVPPGSYTAFAWESAPDSAWLNAEFVSKYGEKGTPVRVGTGANLKLELTWIPFDSDLR